MINKLCKGILSVAMVAAVVFVNSTCCYKIYQEKLPEELNELRKHG